MTKTNNRNNPKNEPFQNCPLPPVPSVLPVILPVKTRRSRRRNKTTNILSWPIRVTAEHQAGIVTPHQLFRHHVCF